MDLTVLLTAVGVSPAVAALVVPAIVGVASLLAALLPHNIPGRGVLDWLAANVGNARNAPPAQAQDRSPNPSSPGGGGGFAYGLVLPLLLGLSACDLSPAQQAQLLRIAQVTCQVEGLLVPVLVNLAPLAGPDGVQVANIEQALVHPMVQAACKSVAPVAQPIAVVAQPVAPVAPAAPVTGSPAAPAGAAS